MVGPFWVIEEGGRHRLLAVAVPLQDATRYGAMLTVETGHYEYWSRLGKRGAARLRADGLPTAPAWSEYEEWPRGRVIYDTKARSFVIRADPKLHGPHYVGLIVARFELHAAQVTVLDDDHYRSTRDLDEGGRPTS